MVNGVLTDRKSARWLSGGLLYAFHVIELRGEDLRRHSW